PVWWRSPRVHGRHESGREQEDTVIEVLASAARANPPPPTRREEGPVPEAPIAVSQGGRVGRRCPRTAPPARKGCPAAPAPNAVLSRRPARLGESDCTNLGKDRTPGKGACVMYAGKCRRCRMK